MRTELIVAGRLARENEMRFAQGKGNNGEDLVVLNNSVAVDQSKDKEAMFINFSAFGKTAEYIKNWSDKGSRVALKLEMTPNKYTNKDGVEVSGYNFTVREVLMLVAQHPESVPGAIAKQNGNNQMMGAQQTMAQPMQYQQPMQSMQQMQYQPQQMAQPMQSMQQMAQPMQSMQQMAQPMQQMQYQPQQMAQPMNAQSMVQPGENPKTEPVLNSGVGINPAYSANGTNGGVGNEVPAGFRLVKETEELPFK